MKRIFFPLFFTGSIAFILVNMVSCRADKKDDKKIVPPIDSTTQVLGYGLLEKLPGIWSGSVSSTTSLGGFTNWTLDFRPISASQVSGKSELDTLNDIFLSFFIVKHGGAYKMAFRNGGSWSGNKRITYEVLDSVYESSNYSFYRFVDFVRGKEKTFYEIEFKNDSMYQRAYTNKYNAVPSAVLHMAWGSKRTDATSAAPAINQFNFPRKTMIKDFTDAFEGHSESVWYSFNGDPYAEADQPYLGVANVSYSFHNSLSVDPNKNVFLLLTTKPLFNGATYDPTALNFISRYVTVSATNPDYTFTYFHPGAYYLYGLYDKDGNGLFNSGDYISYSTNSFSVGNKGTGSASTQINFVIP